MNRALASLAADGKPLVWSMTDGIYTVDRRVLELLVSHSSSVMLLNMRTTGRTDSDRGRRPTIALTEHLHLLDH